MTKLAGGEIGQIEHEYKAAKDLFDCIDLTPRENAAAHLLAVVSNHRAITWQREPIPPSGGELVPPLEQAKLEALVNQTAVATTEYAAFLSEPERAALLALLSKALEVEAANPGARGKGGKPLHKQRYQEQEILRVIAELEYSAVALPKTPNGKKGVKAEVRSMLQFSTGVFNKAWERLRAQGEIKDAI